MRKRIEKPRQMELRERYTKDMMGFDSVRAGLRDISVKRFCVEGRNNNNNKSI
jgi:hypothetical protein